MGFARGLALTLIVSACSAAATTTPVVPPATTVTASNQGGPLEGHTPRGFAGMGTGLFAGDNLNPGFPDGDGVQIYLTFEPGSVPESISSASLSSDALHVRGTPFEDLGTLSAQRVAFEAFGPDLFDLEGVSTPIGCDRNGDTGIACDVTDSVAAAIDSGATSLQFRLRFEQAGDGDGTPDLALFFLTDSNTNEPGIFTLTIEP